MSGVHILAIVATLLTALSVYATEDYTIRYHSLPVIDWLESRPPLTDSAKVPSAIDLAHGLVHATPLLVVRDDARTQMPVFGPPSNVQRVVGGVRDAARITLGSPVASGRGPVAARLDVIVFDRTLRALAWSELMDRAMDIRDPETGMTTVRVAGPEERDMVWVASPGPNQGGIATVVGHRGPVGFELQVTLQHRSEADTSELVGLSGRAEELARQTVAGWTGWLSSEMAVA